MMNRVEIEREAVRLINGMQKMGLLEHVTAYLLFANGHVVNVCCPDCKSILTVEPFPGNNGYNVSCECGTCSGAFKGL